MKEKYEQADEKTLIRGCLRKNMVAQKALYERFNSPMMGVCYRYARNRTDAEDILQEGFIKVFTHLEQYRSDGSLEGWIRRIMVTTAINYLNKNKYLQQNIAMEQAGELADGMNMSDDKKGDEMIQLLHRMPLGYKTIMNMYAIEGYTHKEIGRLLGIAESTSRSQYARAKELFITLRNEHLSPREADK